MSKRILIVEDDRPMTKALELKLTSVGFDAEPAADGKEALDILKKEKFDLIILDLVLPEVNGFEVLKELKKRKNKTPIIVLTNLGQEEDVKRVKDMGARDYFIKSNTTLAEFIKHIDKVLTSKDKDHETAK